MRAKLRFRVFLRLGIGALALRRKLQRQPAALHRALHQALLAAAVAAVVAVVEETRRRQWSTRKLTRRSCVGGAWHGSRDSSSTTAAPQQADRLTG